MEAKNLKPFYALVALLFIVVMAQGYFIYDLKKEQATAANQELVHINQYQPNRQLSSSGYTSNSVDPFVQMQKMQEKMLSSFGQFNSLFANDPFFQEAFAHMAVSPLADIKEGDKEYTIELNIPGADEQKINITTQDNIVTVSATTQKSVDKNESNYIHKERYVQQFSRSFSLPTNADVEKLSSEYKQGILTISVPKKS